MVFLFITLVTAALLLCILCCYVCCCYREDVPQDWDYYDRSHVAEHTNTAQAAAMANFQRRQNSEQAAAMANYENQHSTKLRQDLIMNSVILKAVIVATDKNKNQNNKSNVIIPQVDSKRGIRVWIDQSLKRLSQTDTNLEIEIPPNMETDILDPNPNDNGAESERKCNIYLENRSLRQSVRSSVTSIRSRVSNYARASSMELYTTQSCFICLERYKEGEKIFWSRNERCIHSFHETCMTRWLMDHDDCPLCREDFLSES